MLRGLTLGFILALLVNPFQPPMFFLAFALAFYFLLRMKEAK